MANTVNISEWRGADIVDRSGEKIGKLEDVYYDTETDEPVFLAFKSGMLGRHLGFVPFANGTVGRAYVRVAYDKGMASDGPTIETGGELSVDDEGRLFGYYGLEYSPASTQTARRLARR